MNIKLKNLLPIATIICTPTASIFAQAQASINVTRYFVDENAEGRIGNVWGMANQSVNLKETVNQTTGVKTWMLDDGDQTLTWGDNTIISFMEDAFVEISENPFISFGGFQISNGTNSIFEFTFTDPILAGTLPAGDTLISSSLGLALTDNPSVSGPNVIAEISPTNQPILTARVSDTGNTTSLDDVFLGTVSIPGAAGSTVSQNLNAGTPTSPLTGPNLAYDPDFLSATVKFELTEDDQVAFSGRVDITPVPEPSTYALFSALGIALSVFFIRRKNSNVA